MDIKTFLKLPTEEVAKIVRAHGPKVCVFPINGTRRWFLMENERSSDDYASAYLSAIIENHIGLYKLFFEHGIETLLTPALGTDLWERGDEYVQMVAEGFAALANHPEFIEFFDQYQVRANFYGDYRKFLSKTNYSHLLDTFDAVKEKTAQNDQYKLFFGLFASDATESVAELSVAYYQQHGVIPNKQKIIELYYGEYVHPVSFFVGFDKFSAYDMPLLASGFEDLYFTVSPSAYLSQNQLREILFDHIYSRSVEEPDYLEMSEDAWESMKTFYKVYRETTLGIGVIKDGIWYPKLPNGQE
ncbi:MAG: diterpene synthase [Chloroflexi bacterium HGW-Chloroflexi-6]|nr:MAG: diterpene synthase [Chloroflexi bacterium HGW-Chloroflexi-6]